MMHTQHMQWHTAQMQHAVTCSDTQLTRMMHTQ